VNADDDVVVRAAKRAHWASTVLAQTARELRAGRPAGDSLEGQCERAAEVVDELRDSLTAVRCAGGAPSRRGAWGA
jgi:hypothetical protein